MENSTEGPYGCAYTPPPPTFRHIPHTLRGTIGSSTEGPVAALACHRRTHFGTPLERAAAS
eukprot:7410488-Pyramimonas_sp.AAC.1